jgi:hypothetical protein
VGLKLITLQLVFVRYIRGMLTQLTRNAIVLFCLLLSTFGYAQNIKTDVLVVGDSPSAYAAAIQAAKSGVKTVLAGGKLSAISLSQADRSLKAGFYLGFIQRVDSLQKFPLTDKQSLSPDFTAQVFRGWSDTIKNLTVLPNLTLNEIEKWGKGWEVDFVGREIKAEVVVDATSNNAVAKMAGAAIGAKVSDSKSPALYADKKYRTSVAIAKTAEGIFKPVHFSSFLLAGAENIVLASPPGETPAMVLGQAAGAIAAYSAFFKTSTKNSKVRVIQSELLAYKSRLFHFEDVAESDSSMIAIQQIAGTGILKAKEERNKLYFMPDSSVSTEELKQPFREYYSRSQIWFLDHKADRMTLSDALDLIKFVGSRGDELNREVERAWSSSLRIKGKFDLTKPITRREFAILLNTYLQPFSLSIDFEGNVTR